MVAGRNTLCIMVGVFACSEGDGDRERRKSRRREGSRGGGWRKGEEREVHSHIHQRPSRPLLVGL